MAVLGDGRTEQFYLKHLKELCSYNYAIRPLLFNSINLKEATSLIKQAIKEERNPIFYFTDYDTIVNQNRVKAYEKFKKQFAKYPEVVIIDSMPSIEFWFLLHYCKTTREFRNAHELTSVLKSHIPDYDKKIEYLERIQWVQLLLEGNKMQDAISRSKEVLTQKEDGNTGNHFPFTKMHMAIDAFDKQKINK